MRDKYIEEDFPEYMIFGEYETGEVDVTDHKGREISARIPREQAESLIEDRHKAVEAIKALYRALEESAGEDAAYRSYGQIRPPNS